MINVSKFKKFDPKPPPPMPDKIIVNIQVQIDTKVFSNDGLEQLEQHCILDWINDVILASTREHLSKKDSVEFEVYEMLNTKKSKKSK